MLGEFQTLGKIGDAQFWGRTILKMSGDPRFLSTPKRQILDSSKLKEFPDDNFNFDENGRKLSKEVENTVGKKEIACNDRCLDG